MQRSNELWVKLKGSGHAIKGFGHKLRHALNKQLIVTQPELAQKLGLMGSVLNFGSHLKSFIKSNQGIVFLKFI